MYCSDIIKYFIISRAIYHFKINKMKVKRAFCNYFLRYFGRIILTIFHVFDSVQGVLRILDEIWKIVFVHAYAKDYGVV